MDCRFYPTALYSAIRLVHLGVDPCNQQFKRNAPYPSYMYRVGGIGTHPELSIYHHNPLMSDHNEQ